MGLSANIKQKTTTNVLWLFARYGGSQLMRITLGVIVARILGPKNYTVWVLITIFVCSLATKFVTHCLPMALIQQKDVDDADYSAVFWAELLIAAALAAVVVFVAPWIAAFYEQPALTDAMRVMSLTLGANAVSAVLNARLSRNLAFKQMTIASMIAQWTSAALAVALAMSGFGLWTWVWQQLAHDVVLFAVQAFMCRWLPAFQMRVSRLKRLFHYGWKILAANLLGNLYNNLTGLVLGKVFPDNTLGYYDKGSQIPSNVGDSMNNAVITALFPVFASHQDDRARELDIIRKTMRVNAFLVFPIMAGLALVAEPLIGVLLTDEWLLAAPYMLPAAILWGLYPLDCTLMQAICAVGRSGLHLILEIIRRIFGLACLCVAAFVIRTPMAIAWSVTIGGAFSMLQAMVVSRPLFGYQLRSQMKDMLPPLLLCAAMALAVWPVSLLNLGRLTQLILRTVVGAGVYIGLAAVMKLEAFRYTVNLIRDFFQRLSRKEREA